MKVWIVQKGILYENATIKAIFSRKPSIEEVLATCPEIDIEEYKQQNELYWKNDCWYLKVKEYEVLG